MSSTDTTFVLMYHPALGNGQVLAPLLAVPTYAAHGWLLVDPQATPPPVVAPYLTQGAADSRYLRDWAGAETLTAGAVRLAPDGHIIVRTANGTTRGSYDATEQAAWTVVGGGSGSLTDATMAAAFGSATATKVAAAAELRAALVPKWKPSTAYTAGEFVLSPAGAIVQAKADFTSGATYSASNWTAVPGGASVAHADLARYTPRWTPPAQVNPTVYTAANSFLNITAGPNEDVIVYGRPGLSNGAGVTVQGGRHVRFIGGKYAKSSAGTTLNVGQVIGSVSFEGVEIDASGYNGDAINACGVTSGTLTYPDVFIQKCRVTGVNGTTGTVHADVFQPQGPMGRLFVDLCTFSSNYQGFFISPQQPISGVFMSRTNFTKLANASNPITYMLWFNDGTQNPYPAIVDEVYVDGPAGQSLASNWVWPNAGLVGSAGSISGKPVGAVDNGDGSASWPTVMQIDGKVYSGAPAAGDFAPAGLGIGYVAKATLAAPPPLAPTASFEDAQGFCYTMPPHLATSAAALSGANRTAFMRLRGGKKAASAVTVLVGTGSGNISVGVYANNGQSGRNAAPGAPKATTGSVAMTATGNSEQTIPLGSTIDVVEGDWVGISIDNVTATLGRPQANPINPSAMSGLQCVQTSAFPVPTGTPSGTFPSTPFWYAQIT